MNVAGGSWEEMKSKERETGLGSWKRCFFSAFRQQSTLSAIRLAVAHRSLRRCCAALPQFYIYTVIDSGMENMRTRIMRVDVLIVDRWRSDKKDMGRVAAKMTGSSRNKERTPRAGDVK